jgi:hypothetical protein
MDTTTAFGRRHALDAMTAGFMIELFGSGSLDFEGDGLMSIAPIRGPVGAVPSTLADCEFQVDVSQCRDKQLGVFAALCRSQF